MTVQSGTKRRPKDKPSTHALMMRAVPYFAKDMPTPEIAALFRKSETSIKRWRQHPDVLRALGEVEASVVNATKQAAEDLVKLAWDTLADVMRGEDPKARVEAAKTTLSRLGVPERKEQAIEHSGEVPALRIEVTDENAERVKALATN